MPVGINLSRTDGSNELTWNFSAYHETLVYILNAKKRDSFLHWVLQFLSICVNLVSLHLQSINWNLADLGLIKLCHQKFLYIHFHLYKYITKSDINMITGNVNFTRGWWWRSDRGPRLANRNFDITSLNILTHLQSYQSPPSVLHAWMLGPWSVNKVTNQVTKWPCYSDQFSFRLSLVQNTTQNNILHLFMSQEFATCNYRPFLYCGWNMDSL